MLKRHAPSRRPGSVSASAPLRSASNAMTSPNPKRPKPNPPIFDVAATNAATPRPNLQDRGEGPRIAGQKCEGDSPQMMDQGRSRLQTLNLSSIGGELLQRSSDVAANVGGPSSLTAVEGNQNQSEGTSSRVFRRWCDESAVIADSKTITESSVLLASSKVLVEGDALAETTALCESLKITPTAVRPVRRVKRRQQHPGGDWRVISTSSARGGTRIRVESDASSSERSLEKAGENYHPVQRFVENIFTSCGTNQQQPDGPDDGNVSLPESLPALVSAAAVEGKVTGSGVGISLESIAMEPSSQKVAKSTKVAATAEESGSVVSVDDPSETRKNSIVDVAPLVPGKLLAKKIEHASRRSRRMPRETHNSLRRTEVPAAMTKPADVRQSEKQRSEVLQELPGCPYPGHANVSWVCWGCDGARHHLKTRAAMEPLKRTHGFKVHRVPNDGDCFYSSIKAAVEPESPGKNKKGAGAVPARGVTVAEMRAWVAEEMGDEQLAFYTLQAKANPEDRWLDFVRPLAERIPSDEEVEDDVEQEKRTSTRVASNASNRFPERAANVDEPSDQRSSCEDRGGKGRTDRGGKGRTDRGRGLGRKKTTPLKGRTLLAEEKSLKEITPTDCPRATTASIGKAGRPGRRSRMGRGSTDLETVAKKATSPKKPPTRKSARVGRHAQLSCKKKRCKEETQEEEAGANEIHAEKEGEEDHSDDEGSDDDDGVSDDGALPFVRSVDELRQFVRLEGSLVGHGRCMWADTFAHHVVSRRLGLTILFVDMERAKTAWPYRVLARTVDQGGDGVEERFVVLKREPNHFVLIKTLPLVIHDKAIGAPASAMKGQACFRRSELPDVVRRLWQIEKSP